MSYSNYSWVQLKFSKLQYRKKLSELDPQQEQEDGMGPFFVSIMLLTREDVSSEVG